MKVVALCPELTPTIVARNEELMEALNELRVSTFNAKVDQISSERLTP